MYFRFEVFDGCFFGVRELKFRQECIFAESVIYTIYIFYRRQYFKIGAVFVEESLHFGGQFCVRDVLGRYLIRENMKTFSFELAGLESELVFRKSPSALHVQEITGFEPAKNLSKYTVFADEQFNFEPSVILVLIGP